MLSFRYMEEKDLDLVTALEKQTFSIPWTREGFADTLFMDNVCFLLAELDKKLAGYCCIYFSCDEGEITNVAVAKECRNQGIGNELVKRTVQEARERGILRLILEVRVSNDTAIRLYRKNGFYECGMRKGFYEKPKEDAIVMAAELSKRGISAEI